MSLQEITATQELMRIAINGQSHVDSLLGFYRDQIDLFNDQRAEWAIAYEQCKCNAGNTELIGRQIEGCRSRRSELEGGLALLLAELTAERQRYFESVGNQEATKNRLEDSKMRLRDLMAVCKPITAGNSRLVKSEKPSQLNESMVSRSEAGLPQKKTNLELELINLTKDHSSLKNALQESIDHFKGELDDLISEHSSRGQKCNEEYQEALNSLSEAQSKLMRMTIEYFRLQMSNYEQERQLQEQNELLRLKNMSIVQRLRMLEEGHSNEFKVVDGEVKRRNRQFRSKYDEQLKSKEEHTVLLKEQHERINEIYLSKMKRLQSELRETTNKYSSIEERTKEEASSLRNQIRILSSRLEKEEFRRMREQIANGSEEDSSDSLALSELNQINRQVEELRKQI